MSEVFLNIDSKIVFETPHSNVRIVIINPEALKNVSANELWTKISGCLGKYEYEMWLAEMIVGTAMRDIADGKSEADFSTMAGAALYINREDPADDPVWERLMSNKHFINVFKGLEIFEVVTKTPEEIKLKYIG